MISEEILALEKRGELFALLPELGGHHGTGRVTEIDEINILQASFSSYGVSLFRTQPGTGWLCWWMANKLPSSPVPLSTWSKVTAGRSIAAASIVAKVTRRSNHGGKPADKFPVTAGSGMPGMALRSIKRPVASGRA